LAELPLIIRAPYSSMIGKRVAVLRRYATIRTNSNYETALENLREPFHVRHFHPILNNFILLLGPSAPQKNSTMGFR